MGSGGKRERQALTGSGQPVHPGSGVVPVLKRLGAGRLSVEGTGFFIARYGLFVTAAHVIQELVADHRLGIAFVLHVPEELKDGVHLRRIIHAAYLNEVDLAIGQADNYVEKYPQNPLSNLSSILTSHSPTIGSPVHTYAYPENKVLDFRDDDSVPELRADYFEGNLLDIVPHAPFLPYPVYQTSIRIRGGASGGPVFDESGKVIGVNCRGWDFDGAEHEGDELSTVIPIRHLLDLALEPVQLPEQSWEHHQLPKVGQKWTVRELAGFGHINFEFD